MTEDKDRDLENEEPVEEVAEGDDEAVAPEEPPKRGRRARRDKAESGPSRRELRRAKQIEARERVRDPRALAALGSQERTLPEQLGIPAFFAGLIALLIGIGWAVTLQALKRPGPIICLVLGVLLLGFGVWYGLRTVARQMHGRGSLVVLVSLALTFAMLLLLIGVNALLVTRTIRIDKTQSRYLSLSKQSRDVVRKIAQDVNIYVVVQRNALSMMSYDLNQVRRLLHEYEVVNDRIHWEIVDIYRDPERQKEIGVSFPGKAVVKCGERREEVSLTMDNEQALTSAVYRVTKPDKEVAYYLTGHGELTLEEFAGTGQPPCTQLRKALGNVQMEVKELSLKKGGADKAPVNVQVKGLEQDSGKAAVDDVPDDAKVLLILGPKTPLAQSETAAIDRYLDQKRGGLFIALAFDAGAPDFSNLLSRYQVNVRAGIALDPYKTVDRNYTPMVEYPQGHDVLSNISVLEFPLARVFDVQQAPPEQNPYGGPPPKQDATALVQTSSEGLVAQVKEQPGKKGTFSLAVDQSAPRGPQTVAVLIDTKKEKPPTPPGMPEPPEPEGTGPGDRIVVVGSSLMLTDGYQPQIPLPGTNVDFVAQCVSWLAGGQAISIPERKPTQVTIGFTPAQKRLVPFLLLWVVPLGTIALGVMVWWRRR